MHHEVYIICYYRTQTVSHTLLLHCSLASIRIWMFLILKHSFYLALPSIHCLLVKFLSDAEVDLGGAHTGGCFDVELLAVLMDLHVGVGGCCHSHLPQHGVHSWPGTKPQRERQVRERERRCGQSHGCNQIQFALKGSFMVRLHCLIIRNGHKTPLDMF